MKHLIFMVVLIIAAISPAFSQLTNTNSGRRDNGKDEQEIRKILKERRLAFPRTDKKALLAWFEKYMDKDYILITADAIYSGNEVLSALRNTVSQPADDSNFNRFNRIEEDEQILFFGDTAIATFKRTTSGQLKGASAPITRAYRHSNTFAKRNGEWKLVAEQQSQILTDDFLRDLCPK
jgi:ketosteroid isomerase-like protein